MRAAPPQSRPSPPDTLRFPELRITPAGRQTLITRKLPEGSFRPWQDGGYRAAVCSDSFPSFDQFLIRNNASKIEKGTRLDSRPELTECGAGWAHHSRCQNEDESPWPPALLAGGQLGCQEPSQCGGEATGPHPASPWAGTRDALS